MENLETGIDMIFRHFLLLMIAGFLIVSCNQVQEESTVNGAVTEVQEATEPARDGVFIHISEGYGDPHRVLMPLKMATIMSEDKDVLIYMDIDAVKLLVNGAEDLNFSEHKSAHTYIKQLTENGVAIHVCPSCLQAAGFGEDDLMEGVQIADRDRFFDFTAGRILTMNY